MLIVVQKARSKDRQQMHKLKMDAGQVNKLASPVYVENQGTRAPHVHKEVIFLKKKGKRQNARTVASVVTGKTPAASLGLYSMLKLLP